MEQQNQADLLQEIQEEINYVDPVSPGVRFANFIIDRIILIVLLCGGIFIWAIMAISRGEDIKSYLLFQENGLATILQLLLGHVCTLVYYTVSETAMKGRTIGKFATGTIAITQDGTPFTFKNALMRSLCRIIPFEPFSAFGYMPWHDKFTKTTVVKKTW
ncbi:MAG TPA: RDD family protein [Niastella sp.]